ncbi:MAG: sce7726 family protein, partial [Bacteroidales bacterium]|nr:sce7726 family protein [Bacteroidales bacterium]
KVFEIKTEYDSDNRLALQLENYRKAFNQIFLIIPDSKLSKYKKYDNEIGLITFNGNLKQRFTLHREAENIKKVDPKTIMNILHSHEYKAIVKSYYKSLPKLTSFNQFQKCFNLIEKIPNKELNKHFIQQMKSRDLENVLSNHYYKEFNQLSLALKLSKTERKDMIQNLKSPIKG